MAKRLQKLEFTHRVRVTSKRRPGIAGSELPDESWSVPLTEDQADDVTRIVEGMHKRNVLHGLAPWVGKHAEWRGYVQEAEHQDGLGYWRQYRSASEVEYDFRLYVNALEVGE